MRPSGPFALVLWVFVARKHLRRPGSLRLRCARLKFSGQTFAGQRQIGSQRHPWLEIVGGGIILLTFGGFYLARVAMQLRPIVVAIRFM